MSIGGDWSKVQIRDTIPALPSQSFLGADVLWAKCFRVVITDPEYFYLDIPITEPLP